jgi:hypothetical protein
MRYILLMLMPMMALLLAPGLSSAGSYTFEQKAATRQKPEMLCNTKRTCTGSNCWEERKCTDMRPPQQRLQELQNESGMSPGASGYAPGRQMRNQPQYAPRNTSRCHPHDQECLLRYRQRYPEQPPWWDKGR